MTQETVTALGIGITATASIIGANAFVVTLVVKNAVNSAVINTIKDIASAIDRHENTCPAREFFLKRKTGDVD